MRGLAPAGDDSGYVTAKRGRAQGDGTDAGIEANGGRGLHGRDVVVERVRVVVGVVADRGGGVRRAVSAAVRSHDDARVGGGATDRAMGSGNGPSVVGHPAAAEVRIAGSAQRHLVRELANAGRASAHDPALPILEDVPRQHGRAQGDTEDGAQRD